MASYVARSFFDNVIGLERIVAARTQELDGKNREMQLVFDHVGQGFLTIDAKGALAAQHSRIVTEWFRAPVAGESLWDFFAAYDASFAQWLKLGWDTVVDDIFPLDVAIAQLPAAMRVGERHFELQYQPVFEGGKLQQVLVLVTDITERRAREAADVAQRETMAVFERLMRDRAGFLDFFAEAKDLVHQLATSQGDAAAHSHPQGQRGAVRHDHGRRDVPRGRVADLRARREDRGGVIDQRRRGEGRAEA